MRRNSVTCPSAGQTAGFAANGGDAKFEAAAADAGVGFEREHEYLPVHGHGRWRPTTAVDLSTDQSEFIHRFNHPNLIVEETISKVDTMHSQTSVITDPLNNTISDLFQIPVQNLPLVE